MNQEETMLLHRRDTRKTIKNLTVMSDIFARNVLRIRKPASTFLESSWRTRFDRHRQ